MGDVSAEPTMEEILSSIKRVIEESEGGPSTVRNRRPPPRTVPPADRDHNPDEVLELSERAPMPDPGEPSEPPTRMPEPPTAATPPSFPTEMASPPRPMSYKPMSAPEAPVTPSPAEPILSPGAAEASRGPLEALSRMVVRPEVTGSDTLEGMVRDMLRPMLRDWLDAQLPQIVETMVAKEIARISDRG